MRTVLGVAAAFALVCGSAAADDKVDGKLLVGKWEPVGAKMNGGMEMEFLKDGGWRIRAGNAAKMMLGKYDLDGGTASCVATGFEGVTFDEPRRYRFVIKSLTDDKLDWEIEPGKAQAFYKVKPGEADPDKLVGRWEKDGAKPGEGTTMEFTKGGKWLTKFESTPAVLLGTYTLAGWKAACAITGIEGVTLEKPIEGLYRITSLTADKLEWKGDDGKAETYSRITPKAEK